MGELIKSTFFTDKLRTAATAILLLLVLVLVGLSWAFPRETNLSKQSLTTLNEVTSSLQNAAAKFENSANVTSQLNETLSQQLKKAEGDRDESYRALLQKYGVDPGDTAFGTGLQPIGGVQSSDNGVGGQHVPASTSPAGGDPKLQDPDEKRSDKADGSHPGGKGSQSPTTSEHVGGAGSVSPGQ